YRQLAEKNVATLTAAKPKLIVATCPHCMNAIGKEYAQLGGDFKVVHHTQYLESLVASGKLQGEACPPASPITTPATWAVTTAFMTRRATYFAFSPMTLSNWTADARTPFAAAPAARSSGRRKKRVRREFPTIAFARRSSASPPATAEARPKSLRWAAPSARACSKARRAKRTRPPSLPKI